MQSKSRSCWRPRSPGGRCAALRTGVGAEAGLPGLARWRFSPVPGQFELFLDAARFHGVARDGQDLSATIAIATTARVVARGAETVSAPEDKPYGSRRYVGAR